VGTISSRGNSAPVIQSVIPSNLLDADTKYHINPTGRFVIGGPMGDTGLTGRKIIVDTYGGMGRHGGGAFSGKDPTKVDRSAAYMARYIAKNIVAAGLADKCEVQLAYAIGVAEPVSVLVETFGTEKVDPAIIPELVRANFQLTPKGIIDSLNLRRPIYRKTAAYGHFGRRTKTSHGKRRTRQPNWPVKRACENRPCRQRSGRFPRRTEDVWRRPLVTPYRSGANPGAYFVISEHRPGPESQNFQRIHESGEVCQRHRRK
jgi:hypothetical protein